MSFELRVDIAGVCLYVPHPVRDEVAVLIPDCRKGKVDLVHEDDPTGSSPAEPHAGYLRFDLASLGEGVTVPGGESNEDGPAYEGVHRFDRQVLHFGMNPAPGARPERLLLPSFEAFAPTLQPRPDLFSTTPETLLMRMTLKGGTLTTEPGNQVWAVPMRLHPEKPNDLHRGSFAGSARWTADVPGDEITLTITRFDGADPARLVLRPVEQKDGVMAVHLKIANLCCNALEWKWIGEPDGTGPDVDFKWLYRLLQPPTGSYAELLNGKKFPVPEEVPPMAMGGRHCIGAQKSFEFPQESEPRA